MFIAEKELSCDIGDAITLVLKEPAKGHGSIEDEWHARSADPRRATAEFLLR